MDEDERPHSRAYAAAAPSPGLAAPRTPPRWRAAEMSAGPLPSRPAGLYDTAASAPPATPPSVRSHKPTTSDHESAGSRTARAGSDAEGAGSAADDPRHGQPGPSSPAEDGRLLPALLAALLCFPPTGVAAVSQALLARDRRTVGDLEGAEAALGHARRFAVVSLVLGALLYLAVFLIAVAVGAG